MILTSRVMIKSVFFLYTYCPGWLGVILDYIYLVHEPGFIGYPIELNVGLNHTRPDKSLKTAIRTDKGSMQLLAECN